MPLVFDVEEMNEWLKGKNIDELLKANHKLFSEKTK